MRPRSYVCRFLGDPERMHYFTHNDRGQGDYRGWTTQRMHRTLMTWEEAVVLAELYQGATPRLMMDEPGVATQERVR